MINDPRYPPEFPGAQYDAWKSTLPRNTPINCGDYYEKHSCEGCGDFLTVCMADFLCDRCHVDAFDEGKDEHLLEDL